MRSTIRHLKSVLLLMALVASGLAFNDDIADKVSVGGVAVDPHDPPEGLKTVAGDIDLIVNESMFVQPVSRTRSYETRAVKTPGGDYLYMGVQGSHYAPPGGAYGQKLNSMVAYRSSDKGLTWVGPQFPWEVPYAQHGFIPLIPKGSKRIYCFGTEPVPDQRVGREDCPIAFRYSDDDGRTWSAPALIRPVNDPDYKGMSVMRMCETDSGAWLLGTHTGEWEGTQHLKTRAYVLRSDDQGKTWTLLPGRSPNGWYAQGFDRMDEPRPISLGGKKALIMARTPEGHLWRIFSADDGKTWSEPRPTSLIHPDAPPMVFHLSDGKTLIAFHHNKYEPHRPQFNNRWVRNELWYSTSTDDGLTWSEPRFVLADAHQPEADGRWRQLSYLDLFLDGTTLHMFLSPNWEGALHITCTEKDLKKMPTKAELAATAAKR